MCCGLRLGQFSKRNAVSVVDHLAILPGCNDASSHRHAGCLAVHLGMPPDRSESQKVYQSKTSLVPKMW